MKEHSTDVPSANWRALRAARLKGMLQSCPGMLFRPGVASFGFILYLGLLFAPLAGFAQVPAVEQGEIALDSAALSQEPVQLNGEWVFVPNKLVAPEDAEKAWESSEATAQRVPANWNDIITGQGDAWQGEGIGTYLLKVSVPETMQEVSLRLAGVYSAFNLYANGELVASQGEVADAKEAYDPAKTVRYVELQPNRDGELLLVLQVSNFDFYVGGITRPVLMGTPAVLTEHRISVNRLDLFIFAILFLMGLYHLVLFAFWPKEKSYVLFAGLSLLMAIRIALDSNSLFINSLFDPEAAFPWLRKLEFLTFFLIPPLVLHYVRSLFPQETSKLVVWSVWGIGGLFGLVAIAAPLSIYSRAGILYMYIAGAETLYMLVVLVQASLKRRQGAILFLISGVVIALAFLDTLLQHLGYRGTGLSYSFPIALLLFVVIQSIVVAWKQFWTSWAFESLRTNLEASIEERTKEVESKSSELEKQYNLIEKTNEDLEASIRYAQRMQRAILPTDHQMEKAFPKHFLYYKPLHIVSGDFYWLYAKRKYAQIAISDCTGHGVPGALMSIMGISQMDQVKRDFRDLDVNLFLAEVNGRVCAYLRQGYAEEEEMTSQDGMDLGLIHFDFKKKQVVYAGANRPLYHMRGKEIEIIKGDKFPVGGNQHEDKEFTAHEIGYEPGDRFYLFSDGLTDQFGGPDKRKFGAKRLREFLISTHQMSLEEQYEEFKSVFSKWMETAEQIDDITLFGVEVD